MQTVFVSKFFRKISWEVDVNWLFVIRKSYAQVNFKERNNNNNK